MAARSDSYLPDSRKSVVVALPSRFWMRASAITNSTSHTPMVTQGLRALMRANDSVKGAPLLAERRVSRMRPNYITQVEPFFDVAGSQVCRGKVTIDCPRRKGLAERL